MLKRRRLLEIGSLMAIVFVISFLGQFSLVEAKEIYPAGNITWIVPFAAGGGFDLEARGMAPYLTRFLKELSPGCKGGEIIVKNVAEGGAKKGYTDIHNATPDGYTIGSLTHGDFYQYILGAEKLPWDFSKFTWLYVTSQTYRIIISNKKLSTWEQMLEYSKKNPLKWAVALFGSSMHIDSIIVKEGVGIPAKLSIVKGTQGVISALLRGDADVGLVSDDSAKAIVDAGEVNVLISFSENRIFPNVPTIAEKGYPQMVAQTMGGRIVMGPPNMDPEAQRILIAAGRKVMVDPNYLAFCEKAGFKLKPLFGKDVEGRVNHYIEFLKSIKPILTKYLDQ